MFSPPSRAALPIFTNNDSKPHAGATVAILAAFAQLQHALTQFVAHYPSPWLRSSNRDRRRSRRGTILRRNHDPCSVATLLIATLLVITVAAWPRLALRSNGSASRPADDCAHCGSAPAAQCSTNDRSGSATKDCAADWVLCGRWPVLVRRGHGRSQG